MYILDTNVLSELKKAKSKNVNKDVLKWAKRVPTSSLFLSVITILEIETGILSLVRRDQSQGKLLRIWMDTHVLPTFQDRILIFDVAVAQRCAKIHVPNRKSDRDAIIAATAMVHGMIVVTRNIKDYQGTGVELLNPWEFH
jgi:predicted nucleic acid-binding protein